ncbi:MAG: glycosyltransferase [candidate division NC10 bacterium]|nr:glycosyltransferase [candidate division NC10 bacterium]
MSRTHRILHLITSLGVGGVQHQLAKIVSSYDRSKFSPLVCCLSHKGEIGEELERKGMEVKVLGARASGSSLRTLWKLYQFLRVEPVAVLRPHKYHSALYGVLAGRMAKVPVIVPSFHLPQGTRKARRRAMIRLLSLLSDQVVAVSQAVAENLIAEVGVPRQRVRVIHNGVDLSDFSSLPSQEESRRRLGIPPGRWMIGAVGRMKPQKGFSYLLRSLPLLERGGLKDSGLMMVGDGPARAELEREAREVGWGAKAAFLGTRRDIPQLLPAMDLFAFPSLWEGFGTSLVEAMAAGVPVVASDLPCVREILPDPHYGLLVPPGDVQALAGAILQTWRDRALRESRAEAARERAFQCFSLNQVKEAYEGLFEKLLAQKAAGGLP